MNLILSVNHRCNLRCTYCYGGDKFNSPMSFETALKALDVGFEHPDPILRIAFFGGEPLLETDLIASLMPEIEARAEATGKSVRLGMTTNGTLIEERHLDLFERYKFHIAISLDGDQQAHDCARVYPSGKGSWEHVRDALVRTRDRLGVVSVISVVHPANVERLPESFDAIAELGVRRFAFNLDYEQEWDEAALALLDNALGELSQRALTHYRAGNDFTIQPFHSKIVSHLKCGFSEADKCDFGCAEAAVAPSGRIYPCDRLIGEDGPEVADVVIGHVDTGIDRDKVMALKKPKDTPDEECEGCAILDRCMWWCGCVNYAMTGKVDEVDGVLCHVEQMQVRHADQLAATLFEEQNDPFMKRYYLAAIASKGWQPKKDEEPEDE